MAVKISDKIEFKARKKNSKISWENDKGQNSSGILNASIHIYFTI